jgi:hypothetical protein
MSSNPPKGFGNYQSLDWKMCNPFGIIESLHLMLAHVYLDMCLIHKLLEEGFSSFDLLHISVLLIS